MTASALIFLMMARSVEKTSERIFFPNTMIPLHCHVTSGTRSAVWRSVPFTLGAFFFGMTTSSGSSSVSGS